MRLLIKYIESRGNGKQIHQSEFYGDAATIGRGTDQTVQVPDRRLPLAHSKLTLANDRLNLVAQGELKFTVNNQSSRRALLEIGDEVRIVGHKFRVAAAEADYDFVLEVELINESVEKLRDRFQTRLREVKIPERLMAWSLFLVILVGTLLIPMAGLYSNELDSLRSLPLPDDGQWLTGELHQNHAFLGEDCNLCHVAPFVPTRNVDCLGCHQSVAHHFDVEKHGTDYLVGDRCADCHQEHSTTGSITRTDQAVCTNCHADLQGVGFSNGVLRPVTDFSSNHPDFRVSLLNYGADDQWHTRRSDMWEDGLQEVSNLKFPHDVHVSADGIASADGEVQMICADCHELEKGGLRMKTVNMEDHCASCHQLTFDADSPDRVVPHGSPPELMRTLREYYALQFLSKELSQAGSDPEQIEPDVVVTPSRAVRRPGRVARPTLITDLMAQMQVDAGTSLSVQARAYIDARVDTAAENLFEKQTCTICHEITAVADEIVPWKVLPVKLADTWFPLSEFSHKGHKNMQCEGCHQASDSAVAADILMPDIGSCRQCHGGEDAEALLASNCITCHNFHLEDQPPMASTQFSPVEAR